MILRVKFNKKNYLKYIGHLDLMRLFHRAFSRANINVNYSEGFNPHPKFSIANPLSLGIESEEEYMDIDMEYMEVDEFIENMNRVLPEDVQILDAQFLKKEESIASLISWAFYEIKFHIEDKHSMDTIKQILDNWVSKEEIMITKIRKKGRRVTERQENIKNLLGNVVLKEVVDNMITIDGLLRSGGNGNLKPIDFMEALNRDTDLLIVMDSISIKRLGLYAEKDNNIYKPL